MWLPEGITIETQETWLISAVSAAGDIAGNYTVIAWQ
jgi:hypothetical protein